MGELNCATTMLGELFVTPRGMISMPTLCVDNMDGQVKDSRMCGFNERRERITGFVQVASLSPMRTTDREQAPYC